MEMRACEETGMSRDVTPGIAPLAVALHDSFLSSHCSSCFLQIPPSRFAAEDSVDAGDHPPSCGGCASLRYCSVECRNDDLDLHATSGECHFIRLVHFDRRDETTDLRAALRLLRTFRNLGFLSPRGEPRRIAGLLVGGREQVEEGCELWLRIREGRMLMSRAREMLRNENLEGKDVCDRGGETEAALWVVLTNGVEVQIGEGRAIGIGVYGPRFSWFNHSCSPNACYRFELHGSECFRCDRGSLVYPSSTGPEDDAMIASWMNDERRLNRGSCRFAPRVAVRSIRPIEKGEQVCITYTDLLQPKASRQSDLWSKYGFICSCQRCSASPETYVDHVLSGIKSIHSSASPDSHRRQKGQEADEQADLLDQVVADYLSAGNPKICCVKIEEMLSEGFGGGKFQPLHHLSLKAYMALASIYGVRGRGYGGDAVPEGPEMARAAAAYALLLAGATHHLFVSDPSLMATAAHFWVNAGESFLSLTHCSATGWINLPEFDTVFLPGESSLPWGEFRGTSSRFLDCVSRIASKVWPDLAAGIRCLSEIKSPVDFSWLGEKNMSNEVLGAAGAADSYSGGTRCVGCRCEEGDGVEDDSRSVCRLAVHCLVYGGYLAAVCYGPRSHWVDRIRSLLTR